MHVSVPLVNYATQCWLLCSTCQSKSFYFLFYLFFLLSHHFFFTSELHPSVHNFEIFMPYFVDLLFTLDIRVGGGNTNLRLGKYKAHIFETREMNKRIYIY